MPMILFKRTASVCALVAVASVFTGCLETRNSMKEQEEKQVLRKTVANLQQSTADVNARFQDLEDDVRKLNGRMEGVDNRFNQTSMKIDKGDGALDMRIKENGEKINAYREEITRLNTELETLKMQVASMQEEQRKAVASAAAQASAKEAAAKEKGPFAMAEEKYEQKAWKEAILDYEKYRKANPKGKQFAEATYKIGVSFEELGQSDVAQAFYEEVVAKFPKSKEAGKAKSKLKGLAKK